MLEIDIERAPEEVLAECRRRGLLIKQVPYTGNDPRRDRRHWHIRRPEGPGTLELTVQKDRVWLTVKPNWNAGWAEPLARKLSS